MYTLHRDTRSLEHLYLEIDYEYMCRFSICRYSSIVSFCGFWKLMHHTHTHGPCDMSPTLAIHPFFTMIQYRNPHTKSPYGTLEFLTDFKMSKEPSRLTQVALL